jgi:hypothetical protein
MNLIEFRGWRLCVPQGVTHERIMTFKVRGKLAPRFIGLFKITDKRGEEAYQLEFPPQLSDVHNMFHVSQLKKCL